VARGARGARGGQVWTVNLDLSIHAWQAGDAYAERGSKLAHKLAYKEVRLAPPAALPRPAPAPLPRRRAPASPGLLPRTGPLAQSAGLTYKVLASRTKCCHPGAGCSGRKANTEPSPPWRAAEKGGAPRHREAAPLAAPQAE